MKRTRAVAESESAAVISTMEALEPLDGLEGFTMPTPETEAARGISPGFEIMQGQSEPFSEAETRALIRIRRRMHDQFESSNKKKGAKALYVQLASELYEEGNGQWPARAHTQVSQKWNNLLGAMKELMVRGPSNNRARAFRYEDDLAWYRDQLILDRFTPKQPSAPAGGEYYGAASSREPSAEMSAAAASEAHAKLMAAHLHAQAALDTLDAMRKEPDVGPDVYAMLSAACDHLLNEDRRAPIVELFAVSQQKTWDRDTFLLFLKATLDAYEAAARLAAAA